MALVDWISQAYVVIYKIRTQASNFPDTSADFFFRSCREMVSKRVVWYIFIDVNMICCQILIYNCGVCVFTSQSFIYMGRFFNYVIFAIHLHYLHHYGLWVKGTFNLIMSMRDCAIFQKRNKTVFDVAQCGIMGNLFWTLINTFQKASLHVVLLD